MIQKSKKIRDMNFLRTVACRKDSKGTLNKNMVVEMNTKARISTSVVECGSFFKIKF